MLLNNLFIFAISLFMVARGATLATRYASELAQSFRLSPYTVGFMVVSVISILPETFIAINSAISGIPSFGLGMLFGSNVADLTLVFAIIVLVAGRSMKIESKILKHHAAYPIMLALPLVLGFDGYYSRLDGIALIIAGASFYYSAFRNGVDGDVLPEGGGKRLKNVLLLIGCMAILLVGAHFTVTSSTALAGYFGVSPVLIGMLVVGLGTTIPELFFSLNALKKHEDSLAIGDLLGTVLADATVVIGIVATLHPFVFPQKIVFITGVFMVAASLVLFRLMRGGEKLEKRDALLLILFWLIFVVVEFFANT